MDNEHQPLEKSRTSVRQSTGKWGLRLLGAEVGLASLGFKRVFFPHLLAFAGSKSQGKEGAPFLCAHQRRPDGEVVGRIHHFFTQ